MKIRVTVFVGYSDESRVADKHGDFLVGGYVAPETVWPHFTHAWQERVLDMPPKIPYLHMREIRNPNWKRRFKLTNLLAEARVDEAIKVIVSTGNLFGFTPVVCRADFETTIQEECRRSEIAVSTGIDEPDYICFLAYARLTVEWIYQNYPGAQRVDFVVSSTRKGFRTS